MLKFSLRPSSDWVSGSANLFEVKKCLIRADQDKSRMGALASRQNAGVEEVDVVSNHAYKYPPKSGNYFGSHFIMGGERFDTPQPEAYLFGENADLNFLGSRPTPFPYPPPQPNEPTKTLKSLVNIRKESLRLVKAVPITTKSDGDSSAKHIQYNIEFVFDCDARTSITIYYFCTEDIVGNGLVYTPRDQSLTSETFHYQKGANQLFSQPSHLFDPSKFSAEELYFNPEKEIIPIAIHCVAQDGPDDTRQSHTCISVVERHSDGTYVLKALKQKLFVDGLCYLIQEIYGIENKNIENPKANSDVETEDNGAECVICMCDVRDTLILPCRHLCLCNSCADSLRYQANNCPICRAPFRALLQIRALQKSNSPLPNLPPEGSSENIPSGYEGVSLIEALNGPTTMRPPATLHLESLEDPDLEIPTHLLNRSSLERTPKTSKMVGSPDYEKEVSCSTPEVRMSVLLARENEGSSPKEKGKSPSMSSRWREKPKSKDTVKTVNETASTHDEASVEEEVDSEAEKMSPLLSNRKGSKDDDDDEDLSVGDESPGHSGPQGRGSSPTSQGGKAKAENLMEKEGTTAANGTIAVGDDSDYYTPDDPPAATSPLHNDKVEFFKTDDGLPRVTV
ncbi:probable E3 ubiquitin-protein ligase MGRN1 isoform X2 [Cimex lectularius]|uniref:RING-type E3 ubiquitin transferase n=1 Tax=Cimex lectularius TaxID=79782 RepID=A0A8I6TD87_CIMLE|nr:probable E3 ubiquitin-protein ligase MGRN1 isoform X2 [Cimex lectularius]